MAADVNTSVSNEGSISITMDENKSVEADMESGISSNPEEGGIEFSDGSDGEGEGDENNLDVDAEQGNDGDDEGDGDTPPEDLGEFDPEDTEKWEAQYKNEDGNLNEEALSKEFWANANDDAPGSLNEGTYAYLESIGISKQMAKNVEAALVTQQDATKLKAEKRDDALFSLAGKMSGDEGNGGQALAAALKWGKEGGYSEAQQKRFNAVLKGADEDARLEAVELLMTRYATSGAAPAANKPRLPKRDATKGQGKPNAGLKPFKNREEARQARRDAGNNQKAREMVARRMALGYANS